jgi:hypothetical protein
MSYYLWGPDLVNGGAAESESYIMFDNLMTGATVDAGGDVGMLHDWMTNIFYSAAAGTTTIDLTINSNLINCVALAGVNWASGGVECDVYTWNGSAWVLKLELFGQRDGQPVMRVFSAVTTTKVRFVFTSASTLKVGEVAFGEAMRMPSCPAVGYQPGQWSDNDELSISKTESLNFGPSTINYRGSTEVMQFNFVPYQFLYSDWANFRHSAKGRPIWVGFNQKDAPGLVIFGHWSQSTPKFDSSYFSSIQLTVNGAV